jgi:uncharacterized protein
MRRQEAIDQLKAAAETVAGMGATGLYLYGSTARDKGKADSDLDLFVDYDPQSKFNALDLIGIKLFLEDRMGIEIDLTTSDGLHPRLRPVITQSAIRIF